MMMSTSFAPQTLVVQQTLPHVWSSEECEALHLMSEDKTQLGALPSNAIRVIEFRHGQCVGNIGDVMRSAVPDPDNFLTPEGVAQAKQGGIDLKSRNIKVDLILSSPNTRANQTAMIIAKVLGYPEKNIVVTSSLREEGMGTMEGKKFPEFKASLSQGVSRFVGGAPGGETGDQVRDRMCDLLLKTATNCSLARKTVLWVTHWFPIAQTFRVSSPTAEDIKVKGIEHCLSQLKPGNADWVSFRLPVKQ